MMISQFTRKAAPPPGRRPADAQSRDAQSRQTATPAAAWKRFIPTSGQRFIPSGKTLVRFGISIALLTILLRYVIDPRAVLDTLAQLDPSYGVVAYLIFQLDRVTMAFKWNLLLRARSYRLSHWRATEIYSSAMFLGTLLPTTLGADVVRTVLARRIGLGGVDVIATIAVERSIGFLCALILSLAGLVALRFVGMWDASFSLVLLAGIVGLALVIVALALSFNPRVAALMARMFPARLRTSKVGGKLAQLVTCYQSLGSSRPVLLSFLGLTLFEQLIPVAFTWVIALSFGLSVSPLVMLGAVPLSVLVSRLPISISGIGVFDGAFAALLASSGIAPQYAVAIAFAGRAIEILGCFPWWVRLQLRKGSGQVALYSR
ncbi:MAG TPA: lysylphosphatidylglycerol synthase transmembrane domain-containing protein [Steroidobacteraceae bacterium]|nr:lysylphosphatidylglycerol synthase transmembrane domain-containing protein [Steroidobacteraceae bacterium]